MVANNLGARALHRSVDAPTANSVVVPQTITTGSGPVGAAADEATGEVAITNCTSANTVTVDGRRHRRHRSSISTGQRPIAVGFNYTNHEIAVAASGSNTLGVSDAGESSQTSDLQRQWADLP